MKFRNCRFIWFITLFMCHASFSADNIDGLQWTGIKFEHKIKKAKLSLCQWFRFNDGMSHYFWNHPDVGFSYSVTKWLSSGLNYWHVHKRKGDGPWAYDNRIKGSVTFKHRVPLVSISNRNMIEYWIIDNAHDKWIYRNKATIKFNAKISKIAFKPYISDEIFIDSGLKGFSFNRLYSGISWSFFKFLGFDTGYFWEAGKKDDTPYHYHVLRILLTVHN